ncbi:MAG: hypothetical protein IT370_36345 [Deltaproteobacteria bacterium]|nr:hypothetical protein [Deltaproteobacteria bacterium]
MSQLGPGLEQAFHVAAGELGMCSAAWLFVRELGKDGDALVAELRDVLGRSYPVLDAVATCWLEGRRAASIDVSAVSAACAGASQLLAIGLETSFLDALLPRLEGVAVWLLTQSAFSVDWDRVLANYQGRVRGVDLASFQRLAGRRSTLLVMTYGRRGELTFTSPEWLRVVGSDVRTQFRAVVGWDVLDAPMQVYPRWLVEAPCADFSQYVGAP